MTDVPAPGAELATFAARLNAQAIPPHVLRKTEDLLVDWFGSALAGRMLDDGNAVGDTS